MADDSRKSNTELDAGSGTCTLSQRSWTAWNGRQQAPDPAFLFDLHCSSPGALGMLQRLSSEVDPVEGAIHVLSQLTATALVTSWRHGQDVRRIPRWFGAGVHVGFGVAEQTGFIPPALKSLLRLTPRRLLTPMLCWSILSIPWATRFVLVILWCVMYAAWASSAVGNHDRIASVGGFSANFLPSASIRCAGLHAEAAQIMDPRSSSIRCATGFMSARARDYRSAGT